MHSLPRSEPLPRSLSGGVDTMVGQTVSEADRQTDRQTDS